MLLHRGAPGGQPKQVGGDFYHGDLHQLVAMVSFSEEDKHFSGDSTATLEQWDKIFNAENFTEGSFKGSVRDYFYTQSNGIFNLIFDMQYVQLNDSIVKYRSTGSSGDDENSQYLVQDVMDVLKTRDIKWSLYDWNDDGFVNQLLIIFAGKGQNAGGGSNSIWPHQWWMSEHLKDRQSKVYCEPIPVTFGDKQYLVDCYCAFPELSANDDYGAFGTLCHEYTHCFGFPDFYGTSEGPRNWELMDNGNYNGGGFCPPNFSAHERWMMGWNTPTELTTSQTISNMDATQSYLIRNDGYANEYYIVENRQQSGWDKELPGSGLVIFHVDYDSYVWLNSWVNSNNKMRYHIIPANNKRSYLYGDEWPYPYQDNDSLTNTSKPAATLNNDNSDGTKLMNKSIYDMKVKDGLASFTFTVPTPTAIREQEAEGEPREIYRIGPVSILRYPNGVVRKVIY